MRKATGRVSCTRQAEAGFGGRREYGTDLVTRAWQATTHHRAGPPQRAGRTGGVLMLMLGWRDDSRGQRTWTCCPAPELCQRRPARRPSTTDRLAHCQQSRHPTRGAFWLAVYPYFQQLVQARFLTCSDSPARHRACANSRKGCRTAGAIARQRLVSLIGRAVRSLPVARLQEDGL